MIGMVLVTHGRLAVELLAALEHVVGPQEQTRAVCIGPDDDIEGRRQEILDAAAAVDSGRYEALDYESLDYGLDGSIEFGGLSVQQDGTRYLLDQVSISKLDVREAFPPELEVRIRGLRFPDGLPDLSQSDQAQLGALLGGAVVLERLFERPGLGSLMLNAYAARDIPVLEASVVAAGLLFVVAQAAAGLLQAAVDPRGRT